MNEIRLYISVPVASFRVPRAREYFETLPVPPPATIYGMLLSAVGEVNRRIYEGVEIAIALLSEPEYSVVLRTLWRVKDKKEGLGLGTNRRPDFQELLSDVQLAVWVRDNANKDHNLGERLRTAFNNPSQIDRFGGLCLGESTHLVDELRVLKEMPESIGQLLVRNQEGELSLPIWADHVGSDTNWEQYTLQEFNFEDGISLPLEAWTKIQRKPLIDTSRNIVSS